MQFMWGRRRFDGFDKLTAGRLKAPSMSRGSSADRLSSKPWPGHKVRPYNQSAGSGIQVTATRSSFERTIPPGGSPLSIDPMPERPIEFSRGAEELIGDFRGIPFTEPPRMTRRPTTAMTPLIESLLVKFQIGRNSCEQTIRDHWPEIVGAPNAAYSNPVRIDRGRSLLVLVSHSVVRNELFMHRESIREKVKNLPGCEEVQEINFRAG